MQKISHSEGLGEITQRTSTLETEVGLASAGDMVAPKSQFDYDL